MIVARFVGDPCGYYLTDPSLVTLEAARERATALGSWERGATSGPWVRALIGPGTGIVVMVNLRQAYLLEEHPDAVPSHAAIDSIP